MGAKYIMNDYNMQSMEFDTNIMKDIEKQRIIEQLEDGVLVINFTKKDGTTRRMKATLREDIHGYAGANRDPLGPKANVEREILKEYLAVYDTEKKDWRSFRWDSLIGVNNG